MKVLAISQSFAPGFRGGSIQALTYMTDALAASCEFRVVARDRDPGQRVPLPGIVVDTWTAHGDARVYYSSRPQHPALLRRLVAEAAPDVIFLNSLFATGSLSLLALRRAGLVHVPVVVAPEGELARGALAQKTWKKQPALHMARRLNLLDGVTWVARDGAERDDIVREFPGAAPVVLVPYPGPADDRLVVPPLPKAPGTARLLYLSRVTPKKNLAFLLETLGEGALADLDLEIVGPVDDRRYWARCEALIARLPASVRVHYLGEVTPDAVAARLASAHALVLPSLGENYGYVVAEALEAGRPVLVSTETPWRDLQAAGAGWTLPLTTPAWQAAIRELQALDDDAYQDVCRAARAHGLGCRPTAEATGATLDLLRVAARVAG